MRKTMTAAVAATLLAGCAGLATRPRAGPTTSPTIEGTLRFVLDDPLTVGQRVTVRLANDTDVAYTYNEIYEACALRYSDESGREFLIPPGTHCDLDAPAVVEPGETVILFTWKLEECVKDEWGCVEAEPLAPGTYTIAGEFSPKGTRGPAAEVEATFEIVE